jgi:hypothetical protein
MSDNTKVADAEAEVSKVVLTRDEIRAKVFGAKPLRKLVPDFFGADVEIVQPSLGVILETRQEGESGQISKMLIDYTFVPNTQEKVFEPADAEAIMGIPFGKDMKLFTDTMNEILGVSAKDIEGAIKDATKSG